MAVLNRNGINTGTKRGAFEEAYLSAVSKQKTIIDEMVSRRECVGENIKDGISVKISSANGHSTTTDDQGAATASIQEHYAMWTELIDVTRNAVRFLTVCNRYGLDAFSTSCFPNPLPAPVSNPVVIDTTMTGYGVCQWASLCLAYEEDVNDVVGIALDQPAIFLWVINKLQEITSGMNDYGLARITPGPAYY